MMVQKTTQKNNYNIPIQIDYNGQHDSAYIEKLIAPIAAREADMTTGFGFL